MLCMLCAETTGCYSGRESGFGFNLNILYTVTGLLHDAARASHPHVRKRYMFFFWLAL
jgi:hypothetical protein